MDERLKNEAQHVSCYESAWWAYLCLKKNAIKQKIFQSPPAGFRFDYSLIVHHASFELQMRFINTLMQKLIGKQLAMHYFTAKVLSEYGKHPPMLAYQILKPNKEAQQ